MPTITANIASVQTKITEACEKAGRDPSEVRVVAVSKGRSVQEMLEAYDAGIRLFGENRVQEAAAKRLHLPEGAELHLIGSLQKNKAGKAAGIFAVVHSVDSVELAMKLDRHAEERRKKLTVLLQVNVSGETTKHGFSVGEVEAAVREIAGFRWLDLQGLMAMAPEVKHAEQARPVFRKLRELRDRISAGAGVPLPELSMGMTQDYLVAVEEGATMVRVGRAIFG